MLIYINMTANIAKEKYMAVPLDCKKLKWKLTLNRDPKTLEPSDYILKRTDHRQSELTGYG